MSDSILDAFQRFDKDGTGSISRDELADVLQSLDQAWDNNSIDRLLLQADASGDGELQIEEFLRWIFAETSEVAKMEVAIGNFTYVLSGCSREELNGEYVQTGTTFSRRPVFYCATNQRYLFFHQKKQQWAVFHKLSHLASCRLKTTRAPHLPALAACWGVWKKPKQGGKKRFVKELQMSCNLKPQRTAEEQKAQQSVECAMAPEVVHLEDEKYHPNLGTVVIGSFRKCPELFNGRPVYFNDEHKMYLFYAEWAGSSESDKFQFQKWKISEELKEFNTRAWLSSGKTEACSPVAAAWSWWWNGQKGVYKWTTATFEDLEPIPEGWKDPEFPHDDARLFCELEGKHEWVRAYALSKRMSGNMQPVLFGEIEPGDCQQGGLCACWLYGALAALAEYPSYFPQSVFLTKEPQKQGKYEFRLFHSRKKEWTHVEIDDYLPCSGWGKPIYGKLAKGKMWCALLEKAIAKLWNGDGHRVGYGSFHGGQMELAAYIAFFGPDVHHGIHHGAPFPDQIEYPPQWSCLEAIQVEDEAGNPASRYLQKGAKFQEVKRSRYRVKFTKIEGEGPEEGWVPYYVAGRRVAARRSKYPWHSYAINEEEREGVLQPKEDHEMWECVLELDRPGILLNTSVDWKRDTTDCRSDGLLQAHAYTFLHAKEVNGFCMVCVRNPHVASGFEWQGPWNDQGPEWKAHPEVAEALQVDLKRDGAFWMDWEDFTWNFAGVSETRLSLDGHERVDDDEEDIEE